MTAAQVRERGILFSGPMVRGILEDRKTRTRRVVKPQPKALEPWKICDWSIEKGNCTFNLTDDQLREGDLCPYGQPGDRLWVREAHAIEPDGRVVYRADRAARHFDLVPPPSPTSDLYWLPSDYEPARWRPSIHMPRWASRITLEITDVRIERVEEITEEDARAEGVWQEPVVPGGTVMLWRGTPGGALCSHAAGPLGAFRQLWDSINGPRGHGWDADPWVWVIAFRRLEVAHGR